MSNPIQVSCAHCYTINRILETRLQDQPKCGRCKKPLFTGRPIELSETRFSRLIKHDQLPLVVDFWAPWCGPCKSMAPVFEQLSREMEPFIRFAKLNTEENSAFSSRLGIRSIPTLIMFQNGAETARQAGAMSLPQLRQWIQTHHTRVTKNG